MKQSNIEPVNICKLLKTLITTHNVGNNYLCLELLIDYLNLQELQRKHVLFWNLSIPYMLVKILFFYLGTLLYMIFSAKKAFWKKFAKLFQRLATLLNKRLQYQCFPVSFAKFLRNTFCYRLFLVAASAFPCARTLYFSVFRLTWANF